MGKGGFFKEKKPTDGGFERSEASGRLESPGKAPRLGDWEGWRPWVRRAGTGTVEGYGRLTLVSAGSHELGAGGRG